jgi:protein TonB
MPVVHQDVSLLDEQFRPPPKPPRIERKPEPEPPPEEIDLPLDQPIVENPSDEPMQIDDNLGLDTEGVAGGDAFALRAKKGGRSLLKTTPGTIGDGPGTMSRWDRTRFNYFAAQVKRLLEQELARHGDLRISAYTIDVSLWIDTRGRIEGYRLLGSTGNAELDEQLRTILSGTVVLAESPPPDMPQPVHIRINSVH